MATLSDGSRHREVLLTRGAPGVLVQAKLEGPAVIDLRSLPPNVAEVYVLTIMRQLQRRYRSACAPTGQTVTQHTFYLGCMCSVTYVPGSSNFFAESRNLLQ